MREFKTVVLLACDDMRLPLSMVRVEMMDMSRTYAARAAAVLALREFGHSYTALAEAFGKRAHSTIIDIVRRAKSGYFDGHYPNNLTATQYAAQLYSRARQRLGGAA